MTEKTTAPHILLGTDEYSRYMLRSPAEVRLVLRGLCEHVSQVTVFFNEGKDMLLTTLAAVADDHLILDYGPSSEMNRKVIEVDRHFCVAALDKVRIQFILRGFTAVEHAGHPAFRCALPEEVLRLQRREHYRLHTPVARPLRCMMTIPLPDGETHQHMAHVFDISGGGLGITAPDESVPFEAGMEIPGCRVELPEVGIVTAALQVRSVYYVTLRSGAAVRRAGCKFVGLSGPMSTLVQRYIIKVERERKARESGLK